MHKETYTQGWHTLELGISPDKQHQYTYIQTTKRGDGEVLPFIFKVRNDEKVRISRTLLSTQIPTQSPNFISTCATGTQPYSCTSTTLNINHNSDLLDGQHGAWYAPASTIYWDRLGTVLFPINTGDTVTLNNNSTSGLLVEQTGVFNNVLRVDTTNGWVGINTVPAYALHIDATTVPTTIDTVYIDHTTATDNALALTINSINTATTGIMHIGQDVYVYQDQVVTNANNNLTGINIGCYKAGADTSPNITSVAGIWSQAGQTGSTNVGIHTTYGGFFQAIGDANGTSTAYGIYGVAMSADNNWSGFFYNNIGISGTTSGIVTIKTAAAAGTWTMTLPINDGNANDALLTDGTGVTQWGAVVLGGTAWLLPGNALTVDGTHFLGTTDDVPLSFRVNNQKAGRIDNTLANTFFGYRAGDANNAVTGNNTGVGFYALFTNIAGTANTAVGLYALAFNTANENTAIGSEALYNNTIGISNTASGQHALYNNIDGNSNTADGKYCLNANTSGINNSAIGSYALSTNQTGNHNTAAGMDALLWNTASANSALGSTALALNSTGANNIGLGYGAGYYNTTDSNRLFINSIVRANIGEDQTLSIIYGIQAATTANQHLYINANAYVSNDLSVTGKITIGTRTVASDHQLFVGSNYSAQIGDAFSYASSKGDFVVGSNNSNSRFFFGQSNSAYGGMTWVYNATPASAYLKINSNTGTNFLCLQDGRVANGLFTPTAVFHLKAGTATAGTAPLKFTSGTSLTVAAAGAMEFTTDDLYFTITTGPARKGFIFNDGTTLTAGRVPFATTNGRLTDDSDMTFVTDTLTITKIVIGTSITTVGGTAPVADGTYNTGIGPLGNMGTITTKSGIITAVVQAT
jgi:hypothetical protein